MTGRYELAQRIAKDDGHVSILARSGDRALPVAVYALQKLGLFQSSPGLVTGRYLLASVLEYDVSMFQSSPGLVTGRYSAAITA